MTAEPLATIEGAENRRRITLRRTFRAEIEDVWSALVEPDQVRAWFSPAKIDPRVGGRIEMQTHDGKPMMEGMIRVFEPPRVFEYDWVDSTQTSVVRYELEALESGTRLTLIEHVLTDRNVERRGAGWQHHTERLGAHLRGEPSPPDEARWRTLRALYRAELEKSA